MTPAHADTCPCGGGDIKALGGALLRWAWTETHMRRREATQMEVAIEEGVPGARASTPVCDTI
jgi:hypothetical protein